MTDTTHRIAETVARLVRKLGARNYGSSTVTLSADTADHAKATLLALAAERDTAAGQRDKALALIESLSDCINRQMEHASKLDAQLSTSRAAALIARNAGYALTNILGTVGASNEVWDAIHRLRPALDALINHPQPTPARPDEDLTDMLGAFAGKAQPAPAQIAADEKVRAFAAPEQFGGGE